jgi:AraC family transcriptional regulator
MERFSVDSLGTGMSAETLASLRYEHAFQDPLIAGIAHALASELRTPSGGGGLLAATLSNSLAARLVHNYLSPTEPRQRVPGALDARRLSRVLNYIHDNLEGDLALERLAHVASLSQFHFSRCFKAATGRSPHRYVSDMRLERAKTLLVHSSRSLLDIALALDYSDQANFTRAFRQHVGKTPGEFRSAFWGTERRRTETRTT